ncbi:hypothetical protein J5U18_08825 [Sphingobacteriaceae bacterium WQ 2009]|uniref:Uncharacterized protein n=1 Tax=Rhinopithecimicrobium faecis TaxID=2820698 RepID=A0A8T4HB56_9SPHI|nr:hypothetical protein [Sphingobacteriaceae bacterium WQ 2009]
MVRWILGLISLVMLGFVIYMVNAGDAKIKKNLDYQPVESRVNKDVPVDSLAADSVGNSSLKK